MPPHRVSNDFARANALQELKIVDPGAGGTFDLQGNWWSRVTLTATGTYTLPSADEGTTLLVSCDDTSTITLADASGTIHVFTGTSGTTSVLCTATDANSWGAVRISQTGAGAVAAADVNYAGTTGVATTSVEAALDAIHAHLLYATGWSTGYSVVNLREVSSAGDPGDTAANGGLLASDTTPLLAGSAAEVLHLEWAAGNSDIVAGSITLPANLDGAADMTFELSCSSAGTTNVPSFSILTNFDTGAQVTDTAAGTSTILRQTATATIAAADVPATASSMSFQIVPAAHATDAWFLYGIRINGKVTLFA